MVVGTVVIPKGGITDYKGVLQPPQPIYIIRQSTHEEWAADLRANGGNPDFWDQHQHPFYYEVSID